MRRYGKVDANHAQIVQAFRKCGCSVLSLAALGKGAPDLCVGYGGLSILVEVKANDKAKLTADQREFWDTWKGGVRRVDCMEAVAETAELLRGWHRKLNRV